MKHFAVRNDTYVPSPHVYICATAVAWRGFHHVLILSAHAAFFHLLPSSVPLLFTDGSHIPAILRSRTQMGSKERQYPSMRRRSSRLSKIASLASYQTPNSSPVSSGWHGKTQRWTPYHSNDKDTFFSSFALHTLLTIFFSLFVDILSFSLNTFHIYICQRTHLCTTPLCRMSPSPYYFPSPRLL